MSMITLLIYANIHIFMLTYIHNMYYIYILCYYAAIMPLLNVYYAAINLSCYYAAAMLLLCCHYANVMLLLILKVYYAAIMLLLLE